MLIKLFFFNLISLIIRHLDYRQIQTMNKQNSVAFSKTAPIQILRNLQNELRREILLLQREEKQKNKIKKQIEQTVQDYYTVLVEKRGLGKVVTDDKLCNSYNYVKDLILSISIDVKTGFQILMHCEQKAIKQLCPLLLGMFYDNFNENDPYLKKNITFSELLGNKICQQILEQNFLKKGDDVELSVNVVSFLTNIVLKQFCRLESNREYFDMLANRVLNKIPQSLRMVNYASRGSLYSSIDIEKGTNGLNQSHSISLNNSTVFNSISQGQVDKKIQQAVQEFKSDIISKAEMMPISLRVLCYTIFSGLDKEKKVEHSAINKFIWTIIEPEYLAPFQNSNTKKWNHFKNSYFSETVQKICEVFVRKTDTKFANTLVQKIVNINRDKLVKKEEEGKKHITINGGCVNYMNLYYLFTVIKKNEKHLKKFNERVANRITKIHEMHPNFDFFKSFPDPQTSYLVFREIIYGLTIEKEYQAIYNSAYHNNKIKDMLKMILSDSSFHILPFIEKQKYLKDVFEKVIKEQQVEGEGDFTLGALQHSQQFIMKIKYLVYLMEQEHVNQQRIFAEMITECLVRQKSNIELFQKNKILLLQCLTTISKAKKMVKSQKQAQKNVDYHLKIVKILDTMEINLCITGPSTRPEKEKFTKTGNSGIIIYNALECMHQSNIQEGLKHHSTSVKEAVRLFCDMKEVKNVLQSGKDTFKVYQSLVSLLDYLKDICRRQFNVNIEQYNYFENSVFKVIMREIHEIMIDLKEKSHADIEFQRTLKDLSFIKPNKIKIQGRQNLAELQQIWQISCRYLRSLNEKKNPNQKIESILQMIDVIKISIRKDKNQRQQKQESFDKQSIQVILAYCLIRSKPEKILMNIKFVDVFLTKQKLLSKEGAALQRLKNAVYLIQSKKITQFISINTTEFEEQLWKNQATNALEDMRQSHKIINNIVYI